jgi:hypothetical protein
VAGYGGVGEGVIFIIWVFQALALSNLKCWNTTIPALLPKFEQMKKTIAIALFILLSGDECLAQIRWSISYANALCAQGRSKGFGVEVWEDTIFVSGLIVNEDCRLAALLLKYDLNGNLLLSRILEDSTSSAFAPFLEASVDMMDWSSTDDFILPYTQFNADFDSTKIYIRKFDTNLQDVWTKELQRPIEQDNNYALAARRDNDGNIFVGCCGRNVGFDFNVDIPYCFLQKLDSQGNLIWQSMFNSVSVIREITPLSNGDITLNAIDWNNQSEVDKALIVNIDTLGGEDWRYTTGGLYCNSSTCVEDSQGHITICNTWNDYNPPNQYIYTPFYQFRKLMEIDWSSFQEVDEVKYGRFGENKEVNAAKIMSDGSIVTAGSHILLNQPDTIPFLQGYMFKIDQNMDSVWFRTYWHPEEMTEWGSTQILDFDTVEGGGFVCTGIVTRASQQDQDELWLMRLDAFGCLEPGCQNVNVSEIVIGFENSMKVFPNPVRDHATVQFDIPNPAILQNNFSKTQLIVTDISGREIERMNLPSFGAHYQLELNTSQYASGLYQVHWVSGNVWLDTVELVKE